jgi:crotonobetainyl-CoA:carnitine CoA-transferase CaiB-like acyl-CoA transferase
MRAVELGSCRAVSMAGALLRSVGWEVDKVEPPGGDPLRRRPPLDADGESLLFSALNAG